MASRRPANGKPKHRFGRRVDALVATRQRAARESRASANAPPKGSDSTVPVLRNTAAAANSGGTMSPKPLTNAERQARWRTKRNALAVKATLAEARKPWDLLKARQGDADGYADEVRDWWMAYACRVRNQTARRRKAWRQSYRHPPRAPAPTRAS